MYAQLNSAPHESIYDAVGRWAGAASPRLLRVLLCSGSLGALGAVAIDPNQWPVGLGMVALAALGGWGLLEHRLAREHDCALQAAEWMVAAVAVVAALVVVFVALFLFLGPAPHF